MFRAISTVKKRYEKQPSVKTILRKILETLKISLANQKCEKSGSKVIPPGKSRPDHV